MPVSKKTQLAQQATTSGPVPYWKSDCGRAVVYVGDCREVMAAMEPEQFHAVVTDPPYGLEFMGKDWDAPWKQSGGLDPRDKTKVPETQRRIVAASVTYGGGRKRNNGYIEVANEGTDVSHPFRDGTRRVVYGTSDSLGFQLWFQARAEQILRVAKPGAHLLSFGGTRMWHRMACAVEDAGFDIRDTIMWVYGSGFPKSHDVSKAIDRLYGYREYDPADKRERTDAGWPASVGLPQGRKIIRQTTTVIGVNALSSKGVPSKLPYSEPCSDDAKIWDGWGTALKPAVEPIILARKPIPGTVAQCVLEHGCGGLNIDGCRVGAEGGCKIEDGDDGFDAGTVNALGGHLNSVRSPARAGLGRWPANLLHDGSDEVLALFPSSSSTKQEITSKPGTVSVNGAGLPSHTGVYGFDDSGSAARFFYTCKADKDDRPHGKSATSHPTVKPQSLCIYLVRLITPPNGKILDPFMGSGSTGCAAISEGMRFVGIEQSVEYADIAVGRLKLALEGIGVKDTPPPPKRLRG